MVNLTVLDRQNGVNPPKTAKFFKIHTQDAYVLPEISKTVFKIFSSNINEVTDLVPLTVSDRQNGVNPPKTAKLFKIHTQDAYVLSEISKTVFSICLLYTSPSPRDGLLSRMPSSA